MTSNKLRPSKDELWLAVCAELSKQSTCARKGVGCVLLDKHGHVLSTGYNGVASGLKHCNENPEDCEGSKYDKGEGLGKCKAIHAEQNALLQCSNVMAIHTCYVSTSPCEEQCIKMLLNTSCQRIVFTKEYSKSGKKEWIKSGREWTDVND